MEPFFSFRTYWLQQFKTYSKLNVCRYNMYNILGFVHFFKHLLLILILIELFYILNLQNIPRQQNPGNWGVFVVNYAKYLIKTEDIKRLKAFYIKRNIDYCDIVYRLLCSLSFCRFVWGYDLAYSRLNCCTMAMYGPLLLTVRIKSKHTFTSLCRRWRVCSFSIIPHLLFFILLKSIYFVFKPGMFVLIKTDIFNCDQPTEWLKKTVLFLTKKL